MRKMEKIHFNLRASAVGGERGVPQKLTKITKSPYLWQGQGGGEKENPKILWTSYMEATLVISKCSFCRQTSLGEGRGGLYCSARVRLSSFRLGRHFRRITRRTKDAALWKSSRRERERERERYVDAQEGSNIVGDLNCEFPDLCSSFVILFQPFEMVIKLCPEKIYQGSVT